VPFAGQIKRIVRDENNQPDYFVTFLTYEEEGEVRLSSDKVREGPLNEFVKGNDSVFIEKSAVRIRERIVFGFVLEAS
jgi:hypothetical protein